MEYTDQGTTDKTPGELTSHSNSVQSLKCKCILYSDIVETDRCQWSNIVLHMCFVPTQKSVIITFWGRHIVCILIENRYLKDPFNYQHIFFEQSSDIRWYNEEKQIILKSESSCRSCELWENVTQGDLCSLSW